MVVPDWHVLPRCLSRALRMRVLGIDPGSVVTGYGLVEEYEGGLRAVTCGVIAAPARTSFPCRLLYIYRELHALLLRLQPDCAAVEAVFFARNVQSALRLGQARGVALLALAEAAIEMHEYSALEVKQAVTSYGQAQKSQVQQMVRMLLGLRDVPASADAADALAVAICHCHAARLSARLAGSGR